MNTFKTLLKEAHLGFAALIVILALVWFGGEYLHLDYQTRALIIILVLVLWLVLYIVQKVLAVRSAMMIEKRLRAQALEHVQSARPDQKPEVESLQSQLDDAIAALKSSRLGKGALYEIPWYILIGPPGAGKSTLLRESGLHFPYTSQGRRGLRGVGGTRNCDWWFTDQGILLDTAGRYTTEMEDREEWQAFLDMLKKGRKHKPINGALVSMSVPDLLAASEEELKEHCDNIRDRLDELTRTLEVVFPVYLIFTKCDLFQGFVDFFEGYGKSERSQIWGYTLPYDEEGLDDYQSVFEERFQDLYERLCAERLSMLAIDRPLDKAGRIFSFPVQLALAKGRMAEFVGMLFQHNPYQETSTLRGVYLTSGTQEGNAIDKVLGAMGRAFGVEEEAGQLQSQAVEKKSYFIHDLLTKLVFPDKSLARSSTKKEKRRRLLRTGAALGSVVLAAALIVFFIVSFAGNASLAGEVAEAAAQLPKLDGLHREVVRLEANEEGVPFLLWGYYAGSDLLGPARALYLAQVREQLVRPCTKRLRAEVEALFGEVQGKAGASGAGRGLYETFRRLHELVLSWEILCGRARELNPAQLGLFARVLSKKDRWGPGVAGASSHLEYLRAHMAQSALWIAPPSEDDADLIERVRARIGGGSAITFGFYRIIEDPDLSFPAIDVDRLLRGANKNLLRVRGEFQVPGVYQQQAWDIHVRRSIERESSPIRDMMAGEDRQTSLEYVRSQLRDLYVQEYAKAWSRFLGAVEPPTWPDLDQAERDMKILADPQASPYVEFFEKVWEGQVLKLAPGEERNRARTDLQWIRPALNGLNEIRLAFENFMNHTGARRERFFKEGRLSAKPFLEELRTKLEEASKKLEDAVNISDQHIKSQILGVFLLVRERALAALRAEALDEANGLWNTMVIAPFEKMKGLFPFASEAEQEVSLAEFSALFAPGGGSFSRLRAALQTLGDISLYQERLLRGSRSYNRTCAVVQDFQNALYDAPESKKISVGFRIGFGEKRERVNDAEFGIGEKKRIALSEMMFQQLEPMVWGEGSGKLYFAIKVTGSQGLRTLLYPDLETTLSHGWGLVRLIHLARQDATEHSGKIALEWTFPDPASTTASFLVDMNLLPDKPTAHPFAKGFFQAFAPPAKVDQEE